MNKTPSTIFKMGENFRNAELALCPILSSNTLDAAPG
jgi:hypothetical protein